MSLMPFVKTSAFEIKASNLGSPGKGLALCMPEGPTVFEIKAIDAFQEATRRLRCIDVSGAAGHARPHESWM